MKIVCSYDKLIPVEDVRPHPRNVNQHPDIQLKGLEITLKENEIRHPLIISRLSGLLVAGHARLAVMKKLGMTHVPVVYQAFEDEKKEFQFMVSDNESQRKSWLDPEKFDMHIGELDFGDGFDDKAFGIFTEFKMESKGDDVKGGQDRPEPTESDGGNHAGVEIDDNGELPPSIENSLKEELVKVDLVFTKEQYSTFLRFIDAEDAKYEKTEEGEEPSVADKIIYYLNNEYFH